MLERISNWVVLMFENRSLDSLLGHLPHIAAEGGIRHREVVLRQVPLSAVSRSDAAAAPVPDDHSGEQGFGFDRFGLRVPALVVSPYTERGTCGTRPGCSVTTRARCRLPPPPPSIGWRGGGPPGARSPDGESGRRPAVGVRSKEPGAVQSCTSRHCVSQSMWYP